MIVDLDRFLASEEPHWNELERMLSTLEARAERELTFDEAQRFHYLYQRASAGLAKLAGLPYEPRVRQYLEPLVARAYAEIHEAREKPHRFSPTAWLFQTFPRTFRRHALAFGFSVAVTLVGVALGVFAMAYYPQDKWYLLPFEHLQVSPSERVAYEEAHASENRIGDRAGSFAAMLMTHNTRVSILTLALGMTFGVGTILLLFLNGVMMGAVVGDYLLGGEANFVAGWLLPHGAIEIPSVLIAGQAGLVLGYTLIGRGTSTGVRTRLRAVSDDIVTLIFGVAVLLIWAGIVEAFFSQYHEPVLPYSIKIAFGTLELIMLALFLTFSGRPRNRLSRDPEPGTRNPNHA